MKSIPTIGSTNYRIDALDGLVPAAEVCDTIKFTVGQHVDKPASLSADGRIR